jgi:20S proteasome alpha/beta subunit
LLVYGYGPDNTGHLYEVTNPGKVISHGMRGHAAIGSGSLMAMAALARKPIGPTLHETIYRLLDAKFSSETARDVGKRTHLMIMSKSGKHKFMPESEIQELRTIWDALHKLPDSVDALNIILKSKAVHDI